ncbi:MAG TPA: hypothetical protein PKK41_07735, partial [Methanoculleus sp.]|nr:hypothetical protein [Methanoculleus sp.]
GWGPELWIMTPVLACPLVVPPLDSVQVSPSTAPLPGRRILQQRRRAAGISLISDPGVGSAWGFYSAAVSASLKMAAVPFFQAQNRGFNPLKQVSHIMIFLFIRSNTTIKKNERC